MSESVIGAAVAAPEVTKASTVKPWGESAVFNTKFAAERTMMAAVRTSLSLIGFGFTIFKFFESVVHAVGPEGLIRINAPKRVGATLVSIGLFVLIASMAQHWRFLKELSQETNQRFPKSISLITALLLSLTGSVILVTMLVRL